MVYELGDSKPELVGEGHFIAPNAAVIGRVTLQARSSVWFNCVLRGDADSIEIGEGSNIQDGTIIHADPGFPAKIGANVTVGHAAMIHGCSIGDGSLVGIGAIVLNGARIGRECLIGAGALVTEGMEIPDGSLVLGAPARVKRELSEDQRRMLSLNAEHYVGNAARFAEELKPAE
jgi:carbonic anhydrase/acetyltransferase-like protein (isoleucine patch superfamily)